MPAASATRPMTPSSASISRTRWPLPRPPMAGLQDISPMVAKLVRDQRRARAHARGRRRRLAAGVAAADDDDIERSGLMCRAIGRRQSRRRLSVHVEQAVHSPASRDGGDTSEWPTRQLRPAPQPRLEGRARLRRHVRAAWMSLSVARVHVAASHCRCALPSSAGVHAPISDDFSLGGPTRGPPRPRRMPSCMSRVRARVAIRSTLIPRNSRRRAEPAARVDPSPPRWHGHVAMRGLGAS